MMMNKKILVSLNISTYNWPDALEVCLLSVKQQTILPKEIIVADDGSTEKTALLIKQVQIDFPIPIIHVWQPDEGFQLSKIRNKGIAASSGDYIIQIDGDLILHPKFIEDHISFSKPGTFVTGSRVMINEGQSSQIIQNKDIGLNLFSKGLINKSNGVRNKFLRNYLAERYRNTDIYFMRGCNMAFWRADLLKVNGYNEQFTGWGREDNELAVRLLNNGLKKRVIKFAAVVYHIYHPTNSRANIDANDALLKESVDKKTLACAVGLNQYL